MQKLKLHGKDLRSIGYPQSPVISLAMGLMEKHHKFMPKDAALTLLRSIQETPAEFLEDDILGKIARFFLPEEVATESPEIPLSAEGKSYTSYGKEHIEAGAIEQMNIAVRLPVTVAGALMPDAHQGYGLPIGGVLATENAVIPFGVGVDIGCRMCLSIFDLPGLSLRSEDKLFKKILVENTLFGTGKEFAGRNDHEVLDRPEFDEVPMLKNWRGRAGKQLGTSGSGNHFAEFGVLELAAPDNALGLPPGQYVALLTHSGSRGLGANIANHYTRVAMEMTRLPKQAKHLAWLSLDSQEGIEYWKAMNLAGDYASACHHTIHEKIARVLRLKPMAMVENHHNFAWKEVHDGKEVIVHRKGATPAGKGVLGIIPGSMVHPGYVVTGKGEAASLDSAAHGAGRRMSRSQAIKSVTQHHLKEVLKEHGVELIGGGLDEAPMAYKDIHQVMQSQETLVDIVAAFYPKIVRMDE